MAEIARIRVQVGEGADLGEVVSVVEAFAVTAGCATELASITAAREADRAIARAFDQGGVRALLSLAASREIEQSDFDNLHELENLAHEMEMFLEDLPFRFPYRYGRRFAWAALTGALGTTSPRFGVSSSEPWQRFVERLRAAETAARLPDPDVTVRTLTYRNPVTVELVVDGQTLAALALLVSVLASLPSRLRTNRSRERVARAAVRDAEDQTRFRAELRKELLERIRRGELDIQLEDVSDQYIDKLVSAAKQLGPGEMTFRRSELPEGD
jgi:hypothetical protein